MLSLYSMLAFSKKNKLKIENFKQERLKTGVHLFHGEHCK
jgi:hypothetical protein